MIDLNVKGITLQMHIVVNEDGSFTVRYGEGNLSLEAYSAPELTTSRSITLNTPVPAEGEEQVLMDESEMGAKLAGLIREAIEQCIDKDNSDLCTKNVDTLDSWNQKIEDTEGDFAGYYSKSNDKYIPPAPESDEEE